MTAQELVCNYFDHFFSSEPDWIKIRGLLKDDFSFSGPLVKASSADDYIEQIKAMGTSNLQANILGILSDKDQVAVLYELITPAGKYPTVEWFWVTGDKINAIRLLNDPRPFNFLQE